MTAAEVLILAALRAGDRDAARVLLGRRIQERETTTTPADADTTGRN